jgi:hypothetical protein
MSGWKEGTKYQSLFIQPVEINAIGQDKISHHFLSKLAALNVF